MVHGVNVGKKDNLYKRGEEGHYMYISE
jgi:hypothetical protein